MSTLDKKPPVVPEPLQLQDKIKDDWVQPFGCNHVIVSTSPAKKAGTKKKGHTRTSSGASYCVMCGETVTDSGNEGSDDKNNLETKDEIKPQLEPNFQARSDSKRHSFFSSNRKSASQGSQISIQSAVSCAMHSHKKIKYYCEDHQEVCCSVCVNVLHPKCERVMFIKTELNANLDKKVSSETIEVLKNIRSSFEEIMEYNEKVVESFETQIKHVQHRREALRTKILEMLDEFDRRSDKMIDKFVKIAKRETKSTIDTCLDAINDVEVSCELLKTAEKSKSPTDIFIATQKVLGQKESYAMALSSAITHTKDMHLELRPETYIDNLETLKQIGTVHFTSENVDFPESVILSVSKIPKTDIRSPRSVKDVFTARSLSSSSLSPRKPPLIGKFSVRLADDKFSCENVGATFLPDGRVAVVDMKNCKLKVFDIKFRQGTCLQLSSGPRGITAISPQEIAISLPDESKIQIVSVAKKLKLLRSILTSIPCYGITTHNQEIIVLCDDGFTTTVIQVIDLEGVVLKTITMNKTSRAVLKNPLYLTLNPDGQQIFVTDRGRLVCMDITGAVIFKYTDENLENAHGVAIDDQGRFYVCGTSSNNVHQVSPDGSKICILMTDEDITAPQAVCYYAEKRLLLITSVGSETVALYKIDK